MTKTIPLSTLRSSTRAIPCESGNCRLDFPRFRSAILSRFDTVTTFYVAGKGTLIFWIKKQLRVNFAPMPRHQRFMLMSTLSQQRPKPPVSLRPPNRTLLYAFPVRLIAFSANLYSGGLIRSTTFTQLNAGLRLNTVCALPEKHTPILRE
jgi:hypothetical protein